MYPPLSNTADLIFKFLSFSPSSSPTSFADSFDKVFDFISF
jgi:hypothetical protein